VPVNTAVKIDVSTAGSSIDNAAVNSLCTETQLQMVNAAIAAPPQPMEVSIAVSTPVEGKDSSPDKIEVVCGDAKGLMLVQKRRIVFEGADGPAPVCTVALSGERLIASQCFVSSRCICTEPACSYNGNFAGREMSPTEFEKIGGRAASKKWKSSVRVTQPDGKPGILIGDWLQVTLLTSIAMSACQESKLQCVLGNKRQFDHCTAGRTRVLRESRARQSWQETAQCHHRPGSLRLLPRCLPGHLQKQHLPSLRRPRGRLQKCIAQLRPSPRQR
jgi:hypothetical protein